LTRQIADFNMALTMEALREIRGANNGGIDGEGGGGAS
jgi:hypothetical protein